MIAYLIPLPFAYANEQELNARLIASRGAAEIILQAQLNSQLLITTVSRMIKNINNYKYHAQQFKTKIKINSTEKIINEIFHLIHDQKNKL